MPKTPTGSSQNQRSINFNESISVEARIRLTAEDNDALKQHLRDQGGPVLSEPLREFMVTKTHPFTASVAAPPTTQWQGQLIFTTKKGKTKALDLADTDLENVRLFLRARMPVIVYYPNFLFDIPEKIYLEESLPPAESQPSTAPVKIRRDSQRPFFIRVVQDILDYMDERLSIAVHILGGFKTRENSAADKEALEAQLLKMSSRMNHVIFSAWKEIFPRSKQKEIELTIASDSGGTYFVLTVKEGSNRFQIGERSLGFRWFFTFPLVTEFRKVRTEDPGETIFLLDEPAYNLHSTAQKVLLKLFQKLADRSKLIYTTHSHYLIEPTWLTGAYIIKNLAMDYENEVDFEESNTDITVTRYQTFAANHPDQSTYFQPILDALEYQPSKLEPIPNLVIFEGKFDYYAMRYVNEIILDRKYPLNAYPGSGDDMLRVFRLQFAWGKTFVALLDGDKAGRKAKARYEKELGRIVGDVLFGLNDVNPKWEGCATEGLFTDTEQLRIVQRVHGSAAEYSKRKLFIAIESMLIAREKVPLSQKTLSSFESILDFLAKKLTALKPAERLPDR
ncbi:MAG: AAA family ATPase [Spirochaetales bacterium]|nr:AAA family ATPase [Spirochaetales bacterium]